ncbi:MAG: YggS family pyridoxal phosphate-dependent enzyme [Spirochaetota bacterium]
MPATGIKQRYESLQERVDTICARLGRNPETVRIMAVSKQQHPDRITEALQAGIRLFGENRVGELVQRWPELKHAQEHCLDSTVRRSDVHVSLIGHLQRNKARKVAGFIDSIESIDNVRTIEAVEHSRDENDSMFGIADDRGMVFSVVDRLASSSVLRPRGVMTVAPFVNDEKAIRGCFRSLYRWYELIGDHYKLEGWDTVSMGMSGDYEIAIEEGSTEIRIGTTLFGARNPGNV